MATCGAGVAATAATTTATATATTTATVASGAKGQTGGGGGAATTSFLPDITPFKKYTMSEHGIKWACEYCTYENWPSAIKCTMCRAQRPIGTIITEDPFKSSSSDVGRDWDPFGTEGGSTPLIGPDSSARPRVKSSYSMKNANKWACHMCTYVNWPRAIRCTQCLSQRRARSPTESPQSSGSGSRPVAFCCY